MLNKKSNPCGKDVAWWMESFLYREALVTARFLLIYFFNNHVINCLPNDIGASQRLLVNGAYTFSDVQPVKMSHGITPTSLARRQAVIAF